MRVPLYLFLAAIISLTIFLAAHFAIANWYPDRSEDPVILAILLAYLSTAVAYPLVYPSLKKDQQAFMNRLFGTMVIRMLVGMIAILVVALRFRGVVVEFTLAYLAGHFLLLGFEVYALISKLRPNS